MTSRQEALENGRTRYFTGLPCPYGHHSERLVSTRACVECVRLKKHAWNASNPEKVNAQKRAWRDANIDKARAQNLANQKLHREAANIRNRRYAATHREQLSAKGLARRLANPEREKARIKAWQLAHPERMLAASRRRYAANIQQMPAWADHEAINMIYRAAEVIRVSGFDVHVDHAVPLQGEFVRGLHVHNNLQIIQAKANRAKSNSFEGAAKWL